MPLTVASILQEFSPPNQPLKSAIGGCKDLSSLSHLAANTQISAMYAAIESQWL